MLTVVWGTLPAPGLVQRKTEQLRKAHTNIDRVLKSASTVLNKFDVLASTPALTCNEPSDSRPIPCLSDRRASRGAALTAKGMPLAAGCPC